MNPFAGASGNDVAMNPKPPKPLGFTDKQTNAAYNFQRAQADAVADPRLNMKAFDRAGFSRGKGQQGYAAMGAANAYADQMSQAQQVPLMDAAANANIGLQYDASRDQHGLALARLQEQANQQQALAALQRQGMASGFAGNMFKNLMGNTGGSGGGLMGMLIGNNGPGGLLSGLMG